MALGFLVVNSDPFLSNYDLRILLVAHEQILKLVFVHEFSCTILTNQEKPRVRHSFRRRQELAFVFDILAIFDSRRAGFLILDAFNHLI